MGAKKVAVGWGEEEVFGNELESRGLITKAITVMKKSPEQLPDLYLGC